MSFQVTPLAATKFRHLFGRSDDELAALGARAYMVDAKPGYPCRIALRDAEPGARVILVNFEHQPADSPYRSRHAVFVQDGALEASLEPGEVPTYLGCRQLSVRAFDTGDMMIGAELIDGGKAASCFEAMLSRHDVGYLHVHNAARGCFLASVERPE